MIKHQSKMYAITSNQHSAAGHQHNTAQTNATDAKQRNQQHHSNTIPKKRDIKTARKSVVAGTAAGHLTSIVTSVLLWLSTAPSHTQVTRTAQQQAFSDAMNLDLQPSFSQKTPYFSSGHKSLNCCTVSSSFS